MANDSSSGFVMQVDQQRAVEVPAQMARYAQILAGKHWREVLGEDSLSVQSPVAAALLSAEATPHNAWQVRSFRNQLHTFVISLERLMGGH